MPDIMFCRLATGGRKKGSRFAFNIQWENGVTTGVITCQVGDIGVTLRNLIPSKRHVLMAYDGSRTSKYDHIVRAFPDVLFTGMLSIPALYWDYVTPCIPSLKDCIIESGVIRDWTHLKDVDNDIPHVMFPVVLQELFQWIKDQSPVQQKVRL